MRSPRFEVVHSDSGWFARFRAANGRIVWVTEVYTRRRKAISACTHFGKPMPVGNSTPWPVAVNTMTDGAVEVRDVDERTPEPDPIVLDPPYYLTTTIRGEPWWHDSEYHSRNCFGDECSEATPPKGAEVHGCFGWAATP